MHNILRWLLGPAVCLCMACSRADRSDDSELHVQVDTLPNGQVVVTNGEQGLWPDGSREVTPNIRIGSVDTDGPESFGDIVGLAVDDFERIWVLDRMSCELRVFDREGAHVRTIGRCGAGPGEFSQPVHVDVAPNGNMWVMDPPNARISIFDTAGTYVRSIRAANPVLVLPWPGGFDRAGFYYSAAFRSFRPLRMSLIRHDSLYTPLDTLAIPTDPVEREEFTLTVGGEVRDDERVPFQGSEVWHLSPAGSLWGLVTDQYRLLEVRGGDTVRVVTKEFRPVVVTEEERNAALQGLQDFVDRGGSVDPGRIPSHKPPVRSFFFTDGGLWVERTPDFGSQRHGFDVFDATGQYLGSVVVPFRLRLYPPPLVRDGVLVGVALDSLDVQYVVRARVAVAN